MLAHLLPSRRAWLRQSLRAVVGFPLSNWFTALASRGATDPQRKRACILLWMNGGPSTIDLWDLKPGHANGGPIAERATNIPGIRISEHLPELAKRMQHLALIRSMSTKEGDHGRATFLMRTGNLPLGPIHYPPLGALLAKELCDPTAELPGYVSIVPPGGGYAFSGSGFLGPRYAPLTIGENLAGLESSATADEALRVPNLQPPTTVSRADMEARLALLQQTEQLFQRQRPGIITASHQAALERAALLMRAAGGNAFHLAEETAHQRDAYGRTVFGQACLLARRLVERGVPFVEVSLDGWDSHANNFDTVARLGGMVDRAWSALLDDLKDRGLLDSTLVVWMGEFGRTPRINAGKGRDHYPTAWTTVLSGGGIKGGQVIGRTSTDGTQVEERPVSTIDLLATVCRALGVDPMKQNLSNVGRPIRIVDREARVISEVLA